MEKGLMHRGGKMYTTGLVYFGRGTACRAPTKRIYPFFLFIFTEIEVFTLEVVFVLALAAAASGLVYF
jgi:hypothetical protein